MLPRALLGNIEEDRHTFSPHNAHRYKLLIRNTELLDFHPARLQQPHGPDTLHGGETVSGA